MTRREPGPVTPAERWTQRAKILDLLIAAKGDWVLLPEVMKHAAQCNSRIFELRRLGFVIENRTQKVDGQQHSWFRLRLGAGEIRVKPHQKLAAADPQSTFPQFRSLAAERYPD